MRLVQRLRYYNSHQSLEDKCHRFLNAVEPGTVVAIHRRGDEMYLRPLSFVEYKSTWLRTLHGPCYNEKNNGFLCF